MAIHFTEEQLDIIERSCIDKRSTGVSINQLSFKALIDQAREATRVPHLERQLNEQIRDKNRICGEYQTVIDQNRIKEQHNKICKEDPELVEMICDPDLVDIVLIDNDD